MRKQSIVNRWSALDAAGDYLIKVTLGMDSAIEISRRVSLSSRGAICGEIGYCFMPKQYFYVVASGHDKNGL